jgi:hypothetical protein
VFAPCPFSWGVQTARGGPHPRVAVLVGLAPRNAAGLDWHAGMTLANRQACAIADSGAEHLTAWYEARVAAARANPASMAVYLDPQLPESRPARRIRL